MAIEQEWIAQLEMLMVRVEGYFARSESRQHARDYVSGLLSRVERKNGWQLAEVLGEATPYGIQQFLFRSPWDAENVRDEVRGYAVEHLGEEEGILIVDETGFVKKGTHSAGVQRQYSGTAGRIENCQIGVFVAYATQQGHALIDRALYLPQSWMEDRVRCQQAGIPAQVGFATKPALAQAMLQRALAANVPVRWLTADSIYGEHRPLRTWLESLPLAYVLGISGKETVAIEGFGVRVSELLQVRLGEQWLRLSAGEGSKGPRLFDWQMMALTNPPVLGWRRWLLVRRRLSDASDMATFLGFAPEQTTLETLVEIAGSRWHSEQCFEEAKGEVGLDQYEVRSWSGWYRHISLACLAHTFLSVLRSQQPQTVPLLLEKGGLPPPTQHSLAAFKAQRRLRQPLMYA